MHRSSVLSRPTSDALVHQCNVTGCCHNRMVGAFHDDVAWIHSNRCCNVHELYRVTVEGVLAIGAHDHLGKNAGLS